MAPGTRPPPDDDDALGILPWPEDEDLLERVARSGRAEVRVVPFAGSPIVVLGRGSRSVLECHLAACRADAVPVHRRRGGGCAVVLDPGNVVISAVVPSPGLTQVRVQFDRFTAWVLAGLARMGLPEAERRDVCDLCLGDRKIGGAALYLGRGLAYYSTTLLHSPELTAWPRYLPHPPREPAYRRGRAHADFVTTLGPRLGGTPAELAARLEAVLGPPGAAAASDRMAPA